MMRSVSLVTRGPAKVAAVATTARLMARGGGLLAAAVAVALSGIGPAMPQSSPGLAAAEVPAPSPRRLGAEELDALLAPFAGAPQDMLGVVLDACRYPADLLAAGQWLRTPEATRGPASNSWAPTVRVLAERAPRTVDYLIQDIARTAALGAAYQTQPNDVWLAYGRVTAAREVPAAAAATPPPPPGPPAPSSSAAQAGASATSPGAPAPTATTPAPSSVTTVVTSPPPQQPSATGAALVGGLIGFGAGLLVSELTDDDSSGYGGAPYPPAYAAPLPYAPYAGRGYRYEAARGLQDDRQAAAAERQQSRQSFVTERREDWQAWGSQPQQQPRQQAMDDRQAGPADSGQRAAAAPRPAVQPSGVRAEAGAQRRSAATSGGVAGVRPAAQISTPPRSAGARPAVAASAPSWGPAAGMADGAAAARSRSPAGGGRAAAGRRQ
jgi:F0F1-type ATP synthase membrane subunit c/vacuolar-type H+-ATPase subunit K